MPIKINCKYKFGMRLTLIIFYVYEWYIVETNEVIYVGKGKGKRCSTLNGRNKFFIDMVSTHNCDFRIIANDLNESDAFALEIETIRHYRDNFPQYRLTNQTDGGEGVSGWDATPEYRNHMRMIS